MHSSAKAGFSPNGLTYHLQQLDCRLARKSPDSEPVFYSIHAPLNSLVVLAQFEGRIVDSEQFGWFRVATFPLVDSDEVEYAVVAGAVHRQPDSHWHFCSRSSSAGGTANRIKFPQFRERLDDLLHWPF
jgi:hypothetical protein